MATPREKFQELLKKLFQFDSSDLDFGIYRIMNLKRVAIPQFIEKHLLDGVAAAEFRSKLDPKLADLRLSHESILAEDLL